ncbi:ABC transporter permease [Amphritea balenae]|uniref:ABC transporter permease n=1 Tax=Amphritea balenae TaxID=452629 RepID=A0A3P1STF9_9GAMM|nr:ABC transporter permease [Amphritea balenae]RRD00492.1 ABC transporter permease [Amphritea balenae]GGK70297.1 iron export ABC transporter permease subunit FetB [Amphritea balenae]
MPTISWLSLAWCSLPVIVIGIIYARWSGNRSEILMASARMTLQLVGVGYVLVALFNNPSPWITSGVLALMICAASWIAIRPVRHHQGFLKPAFIALAVSVSVHLAISLLLVMGVDTWYEPRVIIPLAGMYFANTMNAISLAAERYHAELHEGKDEHKARLTAFQAAMIPQINSLLAVGLVALPGMMTGQILSGVSPLIAVRYQIMIMTMVLGAGGIGAALMLWQLGRHYRKKSLVGMPVEKNDEQP